MVTEEIVELDLSDITTGKIERGKFHDSANSHDWTQYKDKELRLVGCAPTWAYMIATHKVSGIVKSLEFNVSGGEPIRVF